MRRTTSPPRWSRPRIGGFSFSSVPRPGAALSRRRRPGRPFRRPRPAGPCARPPRGPRRSRPRPEGRPAGAWRRALAVAPPSSPARPTRTGQFLRDLPVREVQAHEVEARHPHPQRLVTPRQDRAARIVEAGAAPRAAVALAARLDLVPAVAGDPRTTAVRAADALRPAALPDQLVAPRVIDQR